MALVDDGKITVWCLLGRKAGDNTQVLALARELGFDFLEKHILAQPWELAAHLGLRITLAGIDRTNSSPLQAPWPDLVISAGRRNELVARWIKQQSGGSARLVHIGRPWAPLSTWDLVVTTPQYFLPEQDNILHNTLPLHRMPQSVLASAAKRLRPRLENLPHPWIVLLMGGDSGRFVMTTAKGRFLGLLANDLAVAAGGSLLVTDSPRTPIAAGDALQEQLKAPHFIHRWDDEGDNPYLGLLAVADAFVVTGESMSMLGEAAAMSRPLFIFDVGDGDARWWLSPHSYRYKSLSHRLAMRFGPQRMRRDIGNIQSAMIEAGLATMLEPATVAIAGADLADAGASLPELAIAPGKDLERAVQAVRQLVLAR